MTISTTSPRPGDDSVSALLTVDVSGMVSKMSATRAGSATDAGASIPAIPAIHAIPAASGALGGPGVLVASEPGGVPGQLGGREGELAGLLEQARRLQRVTAMLAAVQASLWSRVLGWAMDAGSSVSRSSSSSSSSVELAVRSVAAEFGAALNLSDQQVQRQFNDAYTLVTCFPATHAALDGGLITAAHARVIVRAGAGIVDDVARSAYEGEAVVRAQSTTTWRLKGMLAEVAEKVMPVTLDERHREARKARCITLTDDSDGMSNLSVFLPTLLAHGAVDRIMSMARTIKHDPDAAAATNALNAAGSPGVAGESRAPGEAGAPGDDPHGGEDVRTLSQIAVDVLCDLLLGAAPSTVSDAVAAIRGRVQVTVPMTTLAGVTDTGVSLASVGPVDAESVRILAAHQPGWDRLMTDTVTGDLVAVDRYTPSSAMRRFLAARDEHCRFPGCRRPVHQCDLDHTRAWEDGGETCVDNLAHLCRRHHVLKHNSAWTVENLGGGVLRWTSPLGYEYIDTPPHHRVMFTPAPVDDLAPALDAGVPQRTPPDTPPPF
ncbi:DUF222 domain-containing protein [Microbacterium sp. ZW T5_56]|uniref:HNH endonuclease signature motif containing protein n=1 Tax=Microbacterium sp. ZW T5_56 TaxID=3378081 RepID=UPI0038525F5F